jgi:hypothetical protein
VEPQDLTDEQYFGEMKLMFNTTGWKTYMIELREQADLINDVQLTTSNDNLNYRKGQLATIASLLNFEDTIQRAENESEDPQGETFEGS